MDLGRFALSLACAHARAQGRDKKAKSGRGNRTKAHQNFRNFPDLDLIAFSRCSRGKKSIAEGQTPVRKNGGQKWEDVGALAGAVWDGAG